MDIHFTVDGKTYFTQLQKASPKKTPNPHIFPGNYTSEKKAFSSSDLILLAPHKSFQSKRKIIKGLFIFIKSFSVFNGSKKEES